MLIAALLNKDYNKRPSIFEVAKIPCVKKQIFKFVDENNFREEVMNIMEIDDKNNNNNGHQQENNNANQGASKQQEDPDAGGLMTY